MVYKLIGEINEKRKGLALQFKKKFKDYFNDYKECCKNGKVYLGRVNPYKLHKNIDDNLWVVSFPTKNHWINKSELSSIESGLNGLSNFCVAFKIKSIAIPKLGCGEGGLDWDDVKPLIENEFRGFENIEVYIYE